MKNSIERENRGKEVRNAKEQENKTPEQETPTRDELIRDVKSMIPLTNYRQIWMIHKFVKSILRPGD